MSKILAVFGGRYKRGKGEVIVYRYIYCQSSICQSHHNQDCVQVLVYDRIQEGIQSFCANNSIDEVYNTKFLLIEGYVKEQLNASIAKVDMPFLGAKGKFISAPLDIFAPHKI